MPSKDAGTAEPHEGLHEVIVRLPDALPRRCLENWHHEVERCMSRARQAKHRDLLPPEEAEITERNLGRIHRYLDQSHGCPLLATEGVAEIIREVVVGGQEEGYRLVEIRVRPTYFTVRIAIARGTNVDRIVNEWKAQTTRQINGRLGRKGPLWHPHVFHREIAAAATLVSGHSC